MNWLSPAKTVIEVVFSEFWYIDFEKVRTMLGKSPMPVAPLVGVTDVTVGAVVSAEFAAVNVVTT